MECLQNKTLKVLLIVEGERLEPKFFSQLTKVYGISLDVYVVGTNIYALYQKLKEYNFECDVKDVLPEIGTHLDGKDELLKGKFAYTYLVFDFDAHHKLSIERKQEIAIDTIVEKNIHKLNEMVEYFVDETDPAIGRLYLNYPMMESFRDCTDFFDESYSCNRVNIDKMGEYKSIVGQRNLAGVDVRKYTRKNFDDLTRMNVFKLNSMLVGNWGNPSYSEYQEISNGKAILDYQANLVENQREVDVLNTALFILLDYFGNRDGFYDSIIKQPQTSGEQLPDRKILQPV